MSATVYILLFRGVGGATQLPVKPLREKLADAGFDRVATCINSGNAIVRSERTRKEVVAEVTRICREQFDFEKAIFAPTLKEWQVLVAHNPFPEGTESGKSLHAAWLEKVPDQERVSHLQEIAASGREERFAVVGCVAYLHTPHGFGLSKLAGKFDKVIGVANTARNWNTVRKLAELAEAAARG